MSIQPFSPIPARGKKTFHYPIDPGIFFMVQAATVAAMLTVELATLHSEASAALRFSVKG